MRGCGGRQTLWDHNWSAHLSGCVSRGGCDPNHVGLVGAAETFDAISRWQEGVESRDESRMSLEQSRYPFDDPRSVDILTLKVLHDIQEPVVNIGLILKLNLDLIKIRQRVSDIQGSVVASCCWRACCIATRSWGRLLRRRWRRGRARVGSRSGSRSGSRVVHWGRWVDRRRHMRTGVLTMRWWRRVGRLSHMIWLRGRCHMMMGAIRTPVALRRTMRRGHDGRWMRVTSVYAAQRRACGRTRRRHGLARPWWRASDDRHGWGR